MMNQNQDPFEILEEKINQLMAAYDSLKTENAALAAQLAENKAEGKNLAEKAAKLTQERERAREKIESLLGRLDRLLPSNR